MKLGPQTKRFLESSTTAVIPVISARVKPTKEMNDHLLKKLLGERPLAFVPEPLPPDELRVMKLFWLFTELHSSIERLNHCETYVRSFPFSRTRISRSAYLQFVVEGHLHEIYLLRTRLEKLAKATARLYRKDKDATHITKLSDALVVFLNKALGHLTTARGSHVHEWRYEHADIARLELIRNLRRRNSPFAKPFAGLQRLAVYESHERLYRQALSWNRQVSKVLEEYCKALGPVLFEPDWKTFRVLRSQ